MSNAAPLPSLGLLLAAGVSLTGTSRTTTQSYGSLNTPSGQGAMPLPHLGLLGGASNVAPWAGTSTTRTASFGELTVQAALTGVSRTSHASSGALTAGATGTPQGAMPLPHLGLLGGASAVTTGLVGVSRTASRSFGTLSLGDPILTGTSHTRTFAIGALTTPGAVLDSPMPLPHLGLLGGASPIQRAFTNYALTGAGIDPDWLKNRSLALQDEEIHLTGTSRTTTRSSGWLANNVAPTGIASAQAFGAATVVRNSIPTVAPTGIASAEAVGTPAVGTSDVVSAVNAGGIPSSEAFGTATASRLAVVPVATGSIPFVSAMGTPVVGAADNAINTPNPAIWANRHQAFVAKRWAVATEPDLLGRTEIDPLLGNMSSAPTQPRKMAGAMLTDPVSADYVGVLEVLRFVSADFAGDFALGLSVNADFSGVLAVQSFSSSDYSGGMEVLEAVSREWGGAFDSQVLVDADFGGVFLADGVNALVDATYSGSFDTIAHAHADYSGGFESLLLVDADYAGAFDSGSGVDADFEGSFDALALVGQTWNSFFVCGGIVGTGGIVMTPPPFDNFMTPPPFDNFMTPVDD